MQEKEKHERKRKPLRPSKYAVSQTFLRLTLFTASKRQRGNSAKG
jgi:hypothetical protein